MRITRIRLKDYRGIGEHEVELAPLGVTVVQGPNEIGKSSIGEGLNLLLEHLDSSNRREVKEVKPVGRDVGPEVEVDMETGPYAFTYRKRFLRDRETVLDIHRPRPESLTGREAHERVQSMLGETLDPALWKALRITQGDRVGDIELGGIRSLSAALDAAAGTTPVGDAEASLYERARAEYSAFWTDTGRPRSEAGDLQERVDARRASLDELEVALRTLESDVEAVERLTAERVAIEDQRAADDRLVSELREAWRRVEGLQRQVETAEARCDTARLATERAEVALQAREALLLRSAADRADCEEQAMRAERAAPALVSANERVKAAASALSMAADAQREAERFANLLREDIEHLRERASLRTLREQRERLRVARAGQTKAEALLATNKVTDAALDAIRAASVEMRTARARLEAGSPIVVVESLGAGRIEVDGQPLDLSTGSIAERTVTGRLSVEVPGAVRVAVSAGADGAQLGRALAAAETAYAHACDAAGVEDLTRAEDAAISRREAESERDGHRRAMRSTLEGLGLESVDELDSRIAVIEQRTRAYVERRPAEPPLPAALEAALATLRSAEQVRQEARTAEERARAEDAAAREQLKKVEAAATEVDIRSQLAEQALAASEAALAQARETSSDEDLAAHHAEAKRVERGAEDAVRSARATLESQGPEALKARLDNAEAVLDGADRRLRVVEDQLLEVQTRLRDHQEDGLSERRDKAVMALDVACRELAAYRRRADARKLLHRTLQEARERAHRAYIGPLRERIEELGRVVYGQSFQVELSEDLRVASRTLDGRTVSFDSLSIGTKEQLGVIARLACAIIVAEDEGAPLILDDTLGFSDPGRLEAMGAVLALAGNSCQVIALTCYPDRYRHVGGATVRALA